MEGRNPEFSTDSMESPMLVDVYQHIWTEPLLHALAGRRSPSFIVRTDGLCVLRSAGERPHAINTDGEAPDRRAQLLADNRLDAAVVAISSPIGIEALPREGRSADRSAACRCQRPG
jgi:hypothetical protein